MTRKEEQEKKATVDIRVIVAATAAVLGVVIIAAFYCVAGLYDAKLGYNQGLLAALISTVIVAGARALEGPEPSPENRRRSALSPASQMARSWLSCFIAVGAVFLFTQIITKIEYKPKETKNAGTGVSISGTLQVETAGETRNIEIAGQEAD